ncbi:MAG: peptidyl-tRNA hydrolase Pth2 [Sulfolobales archaeon]
MIDDIKQVIVIRSDLKISIGKIAVQVAHAAVSASEKAKKEEYNWWEKWMKSGQKKIVLKVSSEEELVELYNKSLSARLPVVLIYDAGLTELPPNTLTCLGIGPAPSNLIDKVTGHLPLL